MRIAGGEHAITEIQALFSKRLKLFVLEVTAYLKDRSLGSPGRRLQFMLVHVTMKLAGMYEIARLLLGGKPKR